MGLEDVDDVVGWLEGEDVFLLVGWREMMCSCWLARGCGCVLVG